MNNPLVFFVGAAVVAVTVLAGVTYDRWRDWPTAFQNTAEPPGSVAEDPVAAGGPDSGKAEPDVETAGEIPADESLPEAVAQAPTEEPAAVAEPAQPEEPQPEEVAEVPAAAPEEDAAEPERLAAIEPEEPQPAVPRDPAAPAIEAEAEMRPSFDVVRLEEDGSLIAVGRAAPDAATTLLLDGRAIAASQANEIGEWLIMPDEPLAPGDHELRVEARDPSGTGTAISEAVSLSVPQRAVIAHSEPLPPPSPAADAVEEPEPALEHEPAASEPAEAPSDDAEKEQLALAPLSEPEADLAPEPQIASPSPEQAPQAIEVPLALETVDYNDDGDILFSGRAEPGRSVRIYVDNRFVGETAADSDGHWTFAGREQIAPGRHSLRTDLISPTGKVSGRIELPFMRADSRDIAALVEARREAAEEGVAAPEVEVASEPEAEPEPEAPVVAEQEAPEPEPEAPVVAEQVAPEPEPEAPVVAEQVAPEPEPEEAAAEPDQVSESTVVAAVEKQSEPEPEVVPSGPGHVVIQPGNNLWRISRVIYGRGVEYTVIYQANREQIRDPDLIYPGQIFATPGVHPPKEIDPAWRQPLIPEDAPEQEAAE